MYLGLCLISVVAVVWAITAAPSRAVSREQEREALQRAELSLDERLTSLARSMRQSAALIREVEAELELRAVRAATLKEEAETAERLAQLSAKEREAVAKLLRGELVSEGRRSSRKQLQANVLFFAAGVVASVAITLTVHPLN